MYRAIKLRDERHRLKRRARSGRGPHQGDSSSSDAPRRSRRPPTAPSDEIVAPGGQRPTFRVVSTPPPRTSFADLLPRCAVGRPRVTCASRTSESAFAFGATFTKSPTSPLPKSTRRRSAAARPRTGSAVSANGAFAETSSASPSPSSEPAEFSEPLPRCERRGVASAFSQSASAATGADVGRANLFLSRAATRRARTIRVAAAASFAATSSPFASSFSPFRRPDASTGSVSGNDRAARNDDYARPADGNGGRSAASGDGVRKRRRALCPPSLTAFLSPRPLPGEDMFR